jgi:hypothetical protein
VGQGFALVGGLPLEVARVQDATAQATAKARADQSSRGRSVDGVDILATGTTEVAHKLGRTPNVVRTNQVNSGAPAYTVTARTSRFVTLECTSAGNVDLWVE